MSGIGRLLGRMANSLESLLFARGDSCLMCGMKSATLRWGGLCGRCSRDIPWISATGCDVCGRGEACPDCVRRANRQFEWNRSAVHYDAAMKQWLALYKFRGLERLLPVFTETASVPMERMVHYLRGTGRAPGLITFVPLSRERLADRGFNQAERIAAGLGQRFGLPVVPLLRKARHTDKMSQRSRRDRLHALDGAYVWRPEAEGELIRLGLREPLHVILVDDVYTTGTTVNACAGAIRSRLEARVYGLTWAR